MEELRRDLIKKHIEFDGGGYFKASVEHYYENGKPSGSFFMALERLMIEYHESELKKLRVADVSSALPFERCKCGQNSLIYKAQIEVDRCSRCGNDY